MPRFLGNWWNDPDRELMRREISWAWRWLTGRGRWWVYLWAFGWLYEAYWLLLADPAQRFYLIPFPSPHRSLAGAILMTPIYTLYEILDNRRVVPIILWFCFISWRTLPILEARRLPDLLVSPMQFGKTIVQARAAPIALQIAFTILGFAIVRALRLADQWLEFALGAVDIRRAFSETWDWAVQSALMLLGCVRRVLFWAFACNATVLVASPTRKLWRVIFAVVLAWFTLEFAALIVLAAWAWLLNEYLHTLWMGTIFEGGYLTTQAWIIGVTFLLWRWTHKIVQGPGFENKLRHAASIAG